MKNSHQHPIHGILQNVWGYDSFRPLQEEIISSILDRKETIGLLPTGGGKSLCFQVPALAQPGYSVVVSPLIALIEDQVDALKRRNVSAAGVNFQLSREAISRVFDDCAAGRTKLLYLSPERIQTPAFKELVQRRPPAMLVVDEAHCISQWGHDFRPSYLKISLVKEWLPDLPIHAFTATADKRVLKDITQFLDMSAPVLFRQSFERRNLAFRVVYSENKLRDLVHFLREYRGSGIIYVRSRSRTESIAGFLTEQGIPASAYHAGMQVEHRNRIQQAWMSANDQVMVSTNAFGMGVDKPDVRFVVHLDLPEDIESYYQEAGRAGRDGQESVALVLYNQRDTRQLKDKFSNGFPDAATLRRFSKQLAKQASDRPVLLDEARLQDFQEKGFGLQAVRKLLELLKHYEYVDFDSELEITGRVRVNGSYNAAGEGGSDLLKTFQAVRRFCPNRTRLQPVDEAELARYLGVDARSLIRSLQQLERQGAIEYRPGETAPEIRLRADRDPSRLKAYMAYRKVKKRKMEHMIDFCRLDLCRQLYILRYFGERTSKTCKKCDICTSKENEDYTSSELEAFESKLAVHLAGEGMDVDELMRRFPFFDRGKHASMLQELYLSRSIDVKGKRIRLIE
jgi:ATP-dependent DNA helicase RecQ